MQVSSLSHDCLACAPAVSFLDRDSTLRSTSVCYWCLSIAAQGASVWRSLSVARLSVVHYSSLSGGCCKDRLQNIVVLQ